MERVIADESSKGSVLMSASKQLEEFTLRLFDIENTESTETKADAEIHELRKENHLLKTQLLELRRTYNVPGSADKLDAESLLGSK
jgi:DNA-binding transcriptional regulator YiaG